MNSEMNMGEAGGSEAGVNLGSIHISEDEVRTMRQHLHELANVFTGVMISGDLLSLHLATGPLQHYAADICANSQRGGALVRELRSQLLAACGEVDAASVAVRRGIHNEV